MNKKEKLPEQWRFYERMIPAGCQTCQSIRLHARAISPGHAKHSFSVHEFQKYLGMQKEIMSMKSPMAAKMIARKNRDMLNMDLMWDVADEAIHGMKMCLGLKLNEHPELKKKLTEPGNAVIIAECALLTRGNQ